MAQLPLLAAAGRDRHCQPGDAGRRYAAEVLVDGTGGPGRALAVLPGEAS